MVTNSMKERTYASIATDELARAFPDITKELRRSGLLCFEQGLTAQGYEPKAPADWSRFGGRNVDAEALARCTCTVCGHRGLEYRPWTRLESYRAIARCTECGDWSEF